MVEVLSAGELDFPASAPNDLTLISLEWAQTQIMDDVEIDAFHAMIKFNIITEE